MLGRLGEIDASREFTNSTRRILFVNWTEEKDTELISLLRVFGIQYKIRIFFEKSSNQLKNG
jgi:hypothetical protein